MPVRFEEERPSNVRFEEEVVEEPKLAPEQSALYGAGQGISFGYSDEILGALKAAHFLICTKKGCPRSVKIWLKLKNRTLNHISPAT